MKTITAIIFSTRLPTIIKEDVGHVENKGQKPKSYFAWMIAKKVFGAILKS